MELRICIHTYTHTYISYVHIFANKQIPKIRAHMYLDRKQRLRMCTHQTRLLHQSKTKESLIELIHSRHSTQNSHAHVPEQEAEGLCDRLSILVNGALRCIANPKYTIQTNTRIHVLAQEAVGLCGHLSIFARKQIPKIHTYMYLNRRQRAYVTAWASL